MQHVVSPAPVRVVHVITGLELGGAEQMLYKLLSRTDRKSFEHAVISLTSQGPVGKKIQALGISVRALDIHPNFSVLLGLLRLTHLIRQLRPDIVQTWMYHADLLGGIAAKIARFGRVLWNLRQSNLDPIASKRSTIWTMKVCARLSYRIPVQVICGSNAARAIHSNMGYDSARMTVIPNGFDLEKFYPDKYVRQRVRKNLEISEESIVIGMIARFDPQKDHRTFIHAARITARQHSEVLFLLCGDGISWKNWQLVKWVTATGFEKRFILMGRRSDIAQITTALDIATLSSAFGEGFPNVVGEAMATGVPCVVTDVGDSRHIVGNTGIVVPPKEASSLSDAWSMLIAERREGRVRRGEAARQRITTYFSLGSIVGQYESLYRSIASNPY